MARCGPPRLATLIVLAALVCNALTLGSAQEEEAPDLFVDASASLSLASRAALLGMEAPPDMRPLGQIFQNVAGKHVCVHVGRFTADGTGQAMRRVPLAPVDAQLLVLVGGAASSQ
jgi:hypothetical protein